MLIFPDPLPDEILGGVLARLCRINGINDFRDVGDALFGTGPCTSFIGAEINFPVFARKIQSRYQSVESMLRRMTWIEAQLITGQITEKDYVAVVRGTRCVSLSSLTFCKSCVLSYCPTCREEDVRRFGMSYWHRTHQLPVVFFCPEHGDRLVSVPIKRHHLHTTFPCPNDLKSRPMQTLESPGLKKEFWQGVAAMASSLLRRENLPGSGLLQEALFDELRIRKLVRSRSRRTKHDAICSSVLDQLIGDSTLDPSPEILACIRKVSRGADEPALGEPLGNVVLYYWLFGSWSAVEEKCRWISVFGPANRLCRAPVGDLRSQFREDCRAYLRAYPETTRFEFHRDHYRAFRWLLHNDRQWLDAHLPIPISSGMGEQLPLF